MKKFINVRNILILLIIIIAIIFIVTGRSSDIKTSKAYKLFNTFSNYDAPNGYSETMLKLEYSDDEIEITGIYATDFENERELCSFILNKNEEDNPNIPDISTSHSQFVNIITKNGLDSYILYPTKKLCVTYDTSATDGSEYYASWVDTFLQEMTDNNYYTKGYEFINGKLTYYEYFKQNDLTFYFYNDELIYMKIGDLDASFTSGSVNHSDLRLYSATISHDSFDNSLIEVPEDYEVKNATDMQNTITTE